MVSFSWLRRVKFSVSLFLLFVVFFVCCLRGYEDFFAIPTRRTFSRVQTDNNASRINFIRETHKERVVTTALSLHGSFSGIVNKPGRQTKKEEVLLFRTLPSLTWGCGLHFRFLSEGKPTDNKHKH